MTQLLTGTSLIAVLSLTETDVKLFEGAEDSPVKITPQRALTLARTGKYEGGGTRCRIKYIREIKGRVAKILKDSEFMSGTAETRGRGCMRFWRDQRSKKSHVADLYPSERNQGPNSMAVAAC